MTVKKTKKKKASSKACELCREIRPLVPAKVRVYGETGKIGMEGWSVVQCLICADCYEVEAIKEDPAEVDKAA
jgi:hypothetical protein